MRPHFHAALTPQTPKRVYLKDKLRFICKKNLPKLIKIRESETESLASADKHIVGLYEDLAKATSLQNEIAITWSTRCIERALKSRERLITDITHTSQLIAQYESIVNGD